MKRRVLVLIQFMCSAIAGMAEVGVPWDDAITVNHLSSLQKGKVENITYLISSSLPEFHRSQIDAQIERSRAEKYRETYDFEVKESKVIGGLAMSIVDVTDQVNPLFYDSVAIAFCFDKGRWKATPVVGQYTMTGVGGYDLTVQKSRSELESWGEEQTRIHRMRGRGEAERKLKTFINQHRVKGSPLHGNSQAAAVLYFMQMCRERNFPGILACVTREGEESELYKTVYKGFSTKQTTWTRLLQKNYSFGVLPKIQGSEIVSIGCYFPDEEVENQIFEFEVNKEEGRWRIHLPYNLKLYSKGGVADGRFRSYKLEKENQERLPKVFQSLFGGMSSSTKKSSEKYRSSFLNAIKENDFQSFMGEISRTYSILNNRAEVDSAESKKRLNACSKLWRKTRSMEIEELGEMSTGAYSVQFISVHSKARPTSYQVIPLLAMNGLEGWFGIPEFTFSKNSANWLIPNKVMASVLAKKEELEGLVLENWLAKAVDLDSVIKKPIMENKVVEGIYNKYQQWLAKGNVEECSKYVASHFESKGDLIESIGRDIRGRQSAISSYRFSEVLRSEKMALIVVKLDYKEQTASEYLAYPFIQTQKFGGRLLPNCLYYYPHGRGQIALNRGMLKDLQSVASEQFYEDFIGLIDRFNTKIKGESDDRKK